MSDATVLALPNQVDGGNGLQGWLRVGSPRCVDQNVPSTCAFARGLGELPDSRV